MPVGSMHSRVRPLRSTPEALCSVPESMCTQSFGLKIDRHGHALKAEIHAGTHAVNTKGDPLHGWAYSLNAGGHVVEANGPMGLRPEPMCSTDPLGSITGHVLSLRASMIHAVAQACTHALHAGTSDSASARARPLNPRDTASSSASSLLCNDLSSFSALLRIFIPLPRGSPKFQDIPNSFLRSPLNFPPMPRSISFIYPMFFQIQTSTFSMLTPKWPSIFPVVSCAFHSHSCRP